MDHGFEPREAIKREIVDCLSKFPEVKKIVVFGSFLASANPHDIDIAVFQDSNEEYYHLALKYRKNLRSVSKRIPMDILPLRKGIGEEPFMEEIEGGEVLYER